MKTAVGITMGLFSGFLIYMIVALTIGPERVGTVLVLFTFVGGWVLASLLMIRGAQSVSKVFSRGFLLGAALWLAMIPVGVVMSGKALSETTRESGVQAGAALGAGCASFVTGAFSVAMSVVCLVGFAVSYFIGREMKPELAQKLRNCPECAEQIQASARRCKHCGAVLSEQLHAAPPSV